MPDRFPGCLLGHAVGDALGAPFEGIPADAVYRDFGPIRGIFDDPPIDTLTYTDDTEMTIAVAEVLIEDGAIDPSRLAAAFERNYHPSRGYGPGAQRILDTIRAGGDWQTLAATVFPGGSLGNGAAMRVAPVGLLFHCDEARLLEQARLSALPTHTHPVGIEAAQTLALAVAFVLTRPFDRSAFWATLRSHAATDDLGYALRIASELTPDDTLGTLGNRLEAHRSVPTAIACFARHPDSYADTVCHAISLGGDTDTLAAMAGALSGAYLGISALPRHLLDRLENGDKGRDYIASLARRLFDRTESA